MAELLQIRQVLHSVRAEACPSARGSLVEGLQAAALALVVGCSADTIVVHKP